MFLALSYMRMILNPDDDTTCVRVAAAIEYVPLLPMSMRGFRLWLHDPVALRPRLSGTLGMLRSSLVCAAAFALCHDSLLDSSVSGSCLARYTASFELLCMS